VIAHTHSLVGQAVEESLLAQITHFVKKIIQCEAAKSLRKWMCKVIGKRLNSSDSVTVASEEITREGDVLKLVGVVLMAVRKRTIGYAWRSVCKWWKC